MFPCLDKFVVGGLDFERGEGTMRKAVGRVQQGIIKGNVVIVELRVAF